MNITRHTFVITLAFSLILFFLNQMAMQLPASKPLTAPSNEFSGERAFKILSHLLQEDKPHPVGSALNKKVNQRIKAQLTDLGISFTEQNTWSCAFRYNTCAFVENIIGVIPGEKDTDYVALMAHYDSVPMAPGAGDDGAAVAAILETARILMSEAPFEHPILLVITDAEENGLIGAEAFFRQHPLANKIGIILDFEGSGSTGLSQVLRTSGDNNAFIDAFQRESSMPRGASLINEIFKRMPNDTDFSVAIRAKVPGIDFAFAAERNHYHTPNDNLANIDHRTIQHHGENMLPLTRWLADASIATESSNYVYDNKYGAWLQWPSNYSPYLIFISFMLLLLTFIRTDATLLGTLGGLASSLLVFISTIFVGLIAFKGIAMAQGTTVSWPANVLPYQVTLFSATFIGGLLGALVVNRFVRVNNALIGAWLFWLVLAIPLMIFMPDAVNLLLAPLFIGAIVSFSSTYISAEKARLLQLLSLILVIPSTLAFALTLEEAQGYHLIAATMPFIALFMIIFVPLVHGSSLRKPLVVSVLLTIIAMIIAISNPLYSENRPQHVNINYFENIDSGEAFYQLQSPNPLSKEISTIFDFTTENKALLPYTNYQHSNWAKAPTSGLASAEFTVQEITTKGNERTVDMVLSTPRKANIIQLVFPDSAELIGFELDGISFKPKKLGVGGYQDSNVIRINGSFGREVPLTLIFANTAPIEAYLIDMSTELPETAAALLQERSKLMGPVHYGDQAVLFKKVTF